MAEQSKVYKTTYQLVQLLLSQSDNVPRKWRRVLWEKTVDIATDMLALIVYAYEERDKNKRLDYLDRTLTQFTILNTYIRLCNENAILKTQKVTTIVELTTDISKQIAAWRKSTASSLRNA